MSKKLGTIIVVIVIILIGLNTALFRVDETRQAIIVQLGRPVSGLIGPGLHFKIPFIQEVIFSRTACSITTRPRRKS